MFKPAFAAQITASGIGVTFSSFDVIIKNTILVLIALVGISSMIFLLIGGVKYVISGGDKQALESAKGTITYALVGVALASATFAIAATLQTVLGINILTITI
jgi:uncharacterized membrane protein